MTPSRVVRVVFAFLLLLSLPSIALAATTEFRVLFDLDDDETTGCTVNGMDGVEQVLVTEVTDADGAGRVTRTHRELCTGSVLGGATDIVTTGWDAGWNNTNKLLTVETRIPFAALGASLPSPIRVGFDATRNGSVHTALANQNGTPIVIPEPPARRRSIGVGPDRHITMDGVLTDWGNITPAVIGLASNGTSTLRLLRILAWPDTGDSHLYFAATAYLGSDHPYADDDMYLRQPGQSGLAVGAPGVLQNDAIPGGAPLSVEKVSDPTRGTVVLNADGSFTYSPNHPQLLADDEFEYKAIGAGKESNVARVIIQVGADENPNSPQDDLFTTDEDKKLIQPGPGVLANDPHNDLLVAILATPPSHGTVVLNADGGFTYTPANNFHGTDSFVYTAEKKQGAPQGIGGNATVTIIVNSVNDAPIVQGATFSVPENSPVNTPVGTVNANDNDGDDIEFSIVGGNTGGAFSINAATGQIRVANPAALDYETTPTFSLTIRVEDSEDEDEATVTINLTDTNEPPVINATGTLNYTENDPPTALAPTLTVTDTDSAQLTGATVTISANFASGQDVLSFTPVGAITGVFSGNTLTLSGNDTPANYQLALRSVTYQNTSEDPTTATRTITWTVTDGVFTSNPATTHVAVLAVNDAPSITSSNVASVPENTTAVLTVTASDLEGETLTYSISGGADAALFTINPTTGVLAFASAPNFEAPADAGANNVYDVTVQVSDGTNTPTQAIAVTVTDVNEAPVFSSGATPSVPENTTAVTTVTAADPEGAAITYSITGGADAALFTINASTGALTFVSAPDFEAPADAGANNVYDLVVTASDGTNAPTQNVTVTVTNVDETPVITSANVASVPENTTAVLTVTATDQEGQTLTYSITGGADAALFTINASTGALSFIAPPNFEAPADAGANNVYDVTVQVTDGTHTPAQNIAVTVTDVNEAPVFSSGAAPSVPENTTAVTTVVASDPEGGAVTYSITGGADAALFSINGATGALTFIAPPNFEAPADAGANNVYDVVVTASDGTNTPAQAISVTVTDVNEAPVFTSTATPSIPENTTAVVTVTTADPENNTITYSITGGADMALFTIDGSTGALSFLAAPDYDAPTDAGANNVYDVVVTASDGTNAPTQAIAVTVTDSNEAPVFTSSDAPSVAENTTAVVTVTTTDQEGNTVTYSITGGADAALFTIDTNTGALSFLLPPNFEAPADADADNVYEVIVTANDGTNTPAQTIDVTVTNVDEGSAITSGNTASFDENGTGTVHTVVANDPEGDAVAYAITGGADMGDLSIHPTTGAITFNVPPDFEAPADADANNTYVIDVTATSSGGSDVQTITVTVNDVNEAPAINNGLTIFNIAENTTAVGTITSADPDGTTPTYSISGGADAALFTIDTNTGALSFLSAPDYEAPADAGADNTYEVTVRASDGTLFDDETFTVNVTNVNEAPVFSSSATPSVPENTTDVVFVAAADPEGVPVTYSITGGADMALFGIDSNTGELRFLSAPDFEAPADAGANNVYDVVVTASDGTNAPTQNITVTVTDVNEAPVFTSSATPSVVENTTAVVTVTTTDPEGDSITYSITGGADAALFTINSTTGALSFLSAPDFEAPADADANNVYEVVVTAADGTSSPTQNISVTVTNANEAPAFTSSATPSVPENTTAVVTVVAVDPEGVPVTYSITGGADMALFTINSTTGELSFLSAPNFEAPADAGANNVYDVVVTATDGSISPTQAIAVTVTNVNESPSFTSSAAPSVPENTTAVITVTAADPEGNAVTYSITGGADMALFTINPTTGELSFLSAPDFEAPADAGANNVYDVVVTATDGTSSPTQAIAVTVTDSNEAPSFTSVNSATIPENTVGVLTVTTTDPEGNTVTYSITGGADMADFTIDTNTGVLTFIAPPNFEVPGDADANNVYEVIVTATDGTNTPTQTINVTVTDAQEGPVYTSPNVANFAENGVGTVLTATAVDEDGDAVTYAITGGADSGDLAIDTNTGNITFNASPNFEAPTDSDTNNTYVIDVTATSTGGTAVQTITITVTNVNEQPVITSGAPANVPENTAGTVHTVTATDPDGTSPTFAIVGGADAADFSINTTTGAISFAVTPNFEAPTDANADNVYELTVRATDGTLFDDESYTITVTNVNEAPTAGADTYDYIGNTELRIDGHAGTANALAHITDADNPLDNDTDPDHPSSGFATLSVVAVGPTTTANGSVYRIETDGTMHYTPGAGFTGAEAITYQLTDGTNTVNGTINVSMTGTDVVWYVRNNDPTADAFPTNNGTSSDPFNTLAEAQTASAANHIVYVHEGDGTTTGQNSGFVLKAGQKLWGRAIALQVNGSTTLIASGAMPQIGNAAGAGVSGTNVTGVQIRGLNIGGTTDGVNFVTNGANSGGLTFSNNIIRSAGNEGLDVDAGGTGTMTLAIHDNVFTATGTALDVNRTAGTVWVTAFDDNIVTAASAGAGIVVGSSTATGLTFDATPGGGFDTVSGGTTVIGSAGDRINGQGLTLVLANGALSFSDLDVFTDSGSALIATAGTNGFSLTAPASVVTLVSNAGAAIDIVGATIDLQGVAMTSVNSPTRGVSLDGASGTFSAAVGSSITNATSTDFHISASPANVTYNGTITDDQGQLVTISSNTGTSTKAFTGAITDGDDGDGTGITISGNSATTTVRFSGGVVLSTGSAAAFSASGGGTLEICDENPCNAAATGALINKITTTSGTALNVVSVTIGSNGLEFRSISSNGAPSGIILNNTGAGGLKVKGNSSGACGGTITLNPVGTAHGVAAPVTADCTGGTIQASTSHGIQLLNTDNVSLTRMHILNSGGDGILLSDVNGFTLQHSYITDAAGAAGDRGIELGDFSTGTPVNGTISITNTTVGPTPHDNFGIGIGSGTSSWSISNVVLTGSTLNSGLNFEIRDATVSNFSITNSVFRNQFADGMQMQPSADANATMSQVTIQNNTFQNNNLGLDLNHDGVSNLTYDVLSNTFLGHQSHAVNLFSSAVQSPTTGGTLASTLDGNRIGSAASSFSGSNIGNGIRVNINGGADATVLLNSNVIRQTPNGRGIEVISRNGTGGLDITVTNNNVNPDFVATVENGGFSLSAIFLQSNCLSVCNTLRTDVRNNTVPAAAPTGELVAGQIALIETGASTAQLVDSNSSSANATAELTSNNTGNAAATAGVALIPGPIATP